jgi:hypothetical protein
VLPAVRTACHARRGRNPFTPAGPPGPPNPGYTLQIRQKLAAARMLKRENRRIFRQWLPPFHDGRENQLLFNRLFMIVPAEFRKQGGGIQVSCARIIERPPLEAK